MCPRAESSALLMYCSPVATLYSVNTCLADTRSAVAPALATDTDANTSPTTATRKAALRPGVLAAAPRTDITAESGTRTGLSQRFLITGSLPDPPKRRQPRAPAWVASVNARIQGRDGVVVVSLLRSVALVRPVRIA
jgi:hypothetical protein